MQIKLNAFLPFSPFLSQISWTKARTTVMLTCTIEPIILLPSKKFMTPPTAKQRDSRSQKYHFFIHLPSVVKIKPIHQRCPIHASSNLYMSNTNEQTIGLQICIPFQADIQETCPRKEADSLRKEETEKPQISIVDYRLVRRQFSG